MIRRKTYYAVKRQLKEAQKRIDELLEGEKHLNSLTSQLKRKEELQYLRIRENNKLISDMKVKNAELTYQNRMMELAFDPIIKERDKRSIELEKVLDQKEALAMRVEALEERLRK